MTKMVVHKASIAFLALMALTGNGFGRLARPDHKLRTPTDLTIWKMSARPRYREPRAAAALAISAPFKKHSGPRRMASPEQTLVGSWRCRQMKLGGMTGYAVFNWFPAPSAASMAASGSRNRAPSAWRVISIPKMAGFGSISGRRAPGANPGIAIPAALPRSARK